MEYWVLVAPEVNQWRRSIPSRFKLSVSLLGSLLAQGTGFECDRRGRLATTPGKEGP